MTWLAFFASIIGSLAWPVAIFAIVFLFRRPILARVPGLSEIEYGKFKLKFGKELSEATSKAEQLELPAAAQVELSTIPWKRHLERQGQIAEGEEQYSDVDHNLMLHASIAPVSVVLQSWVPVEEAIHQAAERMGIGSLKRTRKELDALLSHGLIPKAMYDMIIHLQHMRNEAAHHSAFAIDAQQALEYADLAKRLVAALNIIQHDPPIVPSR